MAGSRFENEQHDEQVAVPGRPNIISELANIINNRRTRNVRWPEGMPQDQIEAAKWFREKMEPMRKGEGAVLKQARDRHQYWEYKYMDRLKDLLRKFFRLDKVYQAIVLGASEEGIFWRGETMQHFYDHPHSVYNESVAYREMKPEERARYRVQALAMTESLRLEAEPDIAF